MWVIAGLVAQMTAPRWTRPEPGHTAAMFHAARMALSEAQSAGDVQYAARVLMQCAAKLAAYDHAWSVVRPPLGIRNTQPQRREGA